MSEQDAVTSPVTENTDTAATTTDTSAASTSTDVKSSTTEPSAPSGAETPSMFDAVKAALDKGATKEAPPASETKSDSKEATAQEPEDEEDEADDKGEVSEEEKKLLSAKTQRRIQKLARQRDELKPAAERSNRLDAFMSNNGISAEDAVATFEILALVRSNPEEAYKRVSEFAYNLALQSGKVLPKDIQDRVDAGTIDEATGKELAIARAKGKGLQQVTETLTAESRETQHREHKVSVTNAVNAWAASATKRDPDFAAKQKPIERAFRALLQAGEKFETPEDAVRLMKKAYAEVNEDFKTIRPQQRQETRVPSSTATSAAVSEPKSYEDAIRRSLSAA